MRVHPLGQAGENRIPNKECDKVGTAVPAVLGIAGCTRRTPRSGANLDCSGRAKRRRSFGNLSLIFSKTVPIEPVYLVIYAADLSRILQSNLRLAKWVKMICVNC